MFTSTILEEFEKLGIFELRTQIEKTVKEFHILKEAKHKREAAEKLYGVLQLYSIKDRREKISYVDKRQIDILITLYQQLANQEKMIVCIPPYFSWRK
jgi:ABC-type branched-subunit amino acid transport system ATPase component